MEKNKQNKSTEEHRQDREKYEMEHRREKSMKSNVRKRDRGV